METTNFDKRLYYEVDKNIVETKRIYSKAVKYGSEDAMKALERMVY